MGNVGRVTMAVGTVSGPFFKERLVCQIRSMIKPVRGILHGENPMDYTYPVLLIQISLIFLTTRSMYFLLKPFKQGPLSAQILTGIMLGPSISGYFIPAMSFIFPPAGRVVLNIIADMGAMFHLFILALQMDTTIIKQAGAPEALLATTCFLCPLSVGWLLFILMTKDKMEDDAVANSIPSVLIINSLSSFPVITSLLSDLQILNSELGRFASKISMMNDFSCFVLGQILSARQAFINASVESFIKYVAGFTSLLVSIVYILRPLIIWITRHTKCRHPVDDLHFFVISVSVLLSALGSEVLGQHYLFGPFILGAVLPDGPPLGSEIEHKLQTLSRGLLVPIFCAIGGLNMNLFGTRNGNSYGKLKFLVAVTYVAKFSGVLLPAVCCGLQFSDAFCLALILCSKGIVEVAFYVSWKEAKTLDPHSFNILIISMAIITGVSRPIIYYLYDPAKRYRTSNRRTVRGSNYHNQMRVLVCIHKAENVPMIMNLLKACNPTKYSPVTVFVLHLMKLTGSAAAILVPHHQINSNYSLQIYNAFERLQNRYKGNILVQHFTAVAPYISMHADICTIALDKRTTLVIIPFHKQWSIDGTKGSMNASIRNVNLNVMEMAPCTVGLLIDRGQMGGNRLAFLTDSPLCRIAIFLFGGDDDIEALAISGRLASHPDASLTLVLFKHIDSCDLEMYSNVQQWIGNLPNEVDYKEKIQVKEVTVRNGEETIKQIHLIGDSSDLAIVGRHHDPLSPITLGLTDWSEFPELGLIGDMLSSSDFRFSVLVVTQQPFMAGFTDPKSLSGKSLNSVPSSSCSFKDDE